jgi:hypothetical protein
MTDLAHVSTNLNVSSFDGVSRSSKKIPPTPLLSPRENNLIITHNITKPKVSQLFSHPALLQCNGYQHTILLQHSFQIILQTTSWFTKFLLQ